MTAKLLPPTPDDLAKLAELARAFNRDPTPPPKPSTASRRLRRRLTPEMVSSIVERYQSGDSTVLLSKEHGISRSSLAELLRGEVVTLRVRSITAEATERAISLYHDGDRWHQRLVTPMVPSERCCTEKVFR